MKRGACGVCTVFVTALLLFGCAPLISEYSLDAYKSATTLKAEVAALVDKSGEAYSSHAAEVDTLSTRIDAAYEFAAGLPNNAISTQQWQLMRDPEGGLYGGFVRVWKEKGRTSPFYRKEKKKQLGAAFDYIICLEVNKQRPRSCASVSTASSGASAEPATGSL